MAFVCSFCVVFWLFFCLCWITTHVDTTVDLTDVSSTHVPDLTKNLTIEEYERMSGNRDEGIYQSYNSGMYSMKEIGKMVLGSNNSVNELNLVKSQSEDSTNNVPVELGVSTPSDPQVKASGAPRRKFTKAYKLQILTAYDACSNALVPRPHLNFG